MTERALARLRFVVIALAAVNVLFVVAMLVGSDDRAAAQRIEQLQINPERIKIVAAATRGGGAAGESGAALGACVQWGPIAAADLGRAEAALGELRLAQAPLQRRLQSDRFAYLLREPDTTTVARVAELQRNYPGTDLRAVPCPL